jgi:hypothetical protein
VAEVSAVAFLNSAKSALAGVENLAISITGVIGGIYGAGAVGCTLIRIDHQLPVWRNGRRTGLKILGGLNLVSVRVRPPVPNFSRWPQTGTDTGSGCGLHWPPAASPLPVSVRSPWRFMVAGNFRASASPAMESVCCFRISPEFALQNRFALPLRVKSSSHPVQTSFSPLRVGSFRASDAGDEKKRHFVSDPALRHPEAVGRSATTGSARRFFILAAGRRGNSQPGRAALPSDRHLRDAVILPLPQVWLCFPGASCFLMRSQ